MQPLRLLLSALLVAALTIVAPPQRASAAACDILDRPTQTVYLPNITKTLGGPNGWVTPFIVQNVGFVSTTLQVYFHRFSDGALVSCQKIRQVGIGNSFAHVPNADPALPDNSQFSVVVRSYGSQIVAVVNEHAGTGSRAEALSYVGLSSGDKRVALPYVAKFVDDWLTTIVIQNLGVATTTVTASFQSLDGTRTKTLTRTIAPGQSAVIDPTVERSLAQGVEYAAVLTASQPLGAIVNAHNDAPTALRPMGFSYNGVGIGLPTGPYAFLGFGPTYVPYVARNADGVGRTSRLIVQNAGTSSAAPTLAFSRFGGGGSRTISGPTLGPGRSWNVDLASVADGEHGLTVTGGTFAVLNALITPDTAMAYTGARPSESRVFLPNVTRTLGGPGGWTTPIILQSGGPTMASLRWFRFTDGKLVTRQTVGGLSRGVSVRVDPRTVSGLAEGTQYSVVVDAPGPITAIVTELASAGGDSAMIYEGFPGLSDTGPRPTIVTVAPEAITLGLGGTQQLTATVLDQFGGTLGSGVKWSVSPPELASVSPGGLLSVTGFGSGLVTATAGSASGTAAITVLSPVRPAVETQLGYSFQRVTIDRGTFGVHLIKERLADVTIRTVTANATECEFDCPAKPLGEYMRETGAYAGMNGTYLCPPDYAQCAGKVNTYEYTVYNSYLNTWLNDYALVSPHNALVTVDGDTVRFYRHTYSYVQSGVTAAISNYPILLLGGQVVDTEAEQAAYQKLRGTKGSIGSDGTHVYLALVSGASVTDSAHVLQALGVLDAMNLDGGGTSAMYISGGYKVGPGRLLPNAVLLTKP